MIVEIAPVLGEPRRLFVGTGVFFEVSLSKLRDHRHGAITQSLSSGVFARSDQPAQAPRFVASLFGGELDAVSPHRHAVDATVAAVLQEIDAPAFRRHLASKAGDFAIPEESVAQSGLKRLDSPFRDLVAHSHTEGLKRSPSPGAKVASGPLSSNGPAMGRTEVRGYCGVGQRSPGVASTLSTI